MKNIILLIGIAILPVLVQSQIFPACDSVQVECCLFNNAGPETITIQVANQSSYLFPYPGFILFNVDYDTIALETVNYFGIGTFPQDHILNIISPFELPFEGSLELYSGFFETYNCTFPLMIEDSVQTNIHGLHVDILSIYPNPAKDVITLEIDKIQTNNGCSLLVLDPLGQTIFQKSISTNKIQLQSKDLGSSGIYYIRILSKDGVLLSNKKVIFLD